MRLPGLSEGQPKPQLGGQTGPLGTVLFLTPAPDTGRRQYLQRCPCLGERKVRSLLTFSSPWAFPLYRIQAELKLGHMYRCVKVWDMNLAWPVGPEWEPLSSERASLSTTQPEHLLSAWPPALCPHTTRTGSKLPWGRTARRRCGFCLSQGTERE